MLIGGVFILLASYIEMIMLRHLALGLDRFSMKYQVQKKKIPGAAIVTQWSLNINIPQLSRKIFGASNSKHIKSG